MARKQDRQDTTDISSEDGFIEHEDDAETLWEVIEIIEERGNWFKVRWDGFDGTGKPWAPSWVPKSDCTNPLVNAWKRKKAEKKKNAKRNSAVLSRGSAASSNSKGSAGPSATVTHSSASRSGQPKFATAGTKRKDHHHPRSPGSTPSRDSDFDTVPSDRPRKKRKIIVEISPSSGPPSNAQVRSTPIVSPGTAATRKVEEKEDKRKGSTNRHQQTKQSTSAVKSSLFLGSDDEESPTRKSKKKNEGSLAPTRQMAKENPPKVTHSSTISSRRRTSSATSHASSSTTNPHRPPSNLTKRGTRDNTSTREKQEKDQLDSSNEVEPQTTTTPVRSGSGPKQVVHSPTIIDLTLERSPSPPNEPEVLRPLTSTSTTAGSKVEERVVESNGYADTNHPQNATYESSEGGLEYADFEPAPPLPSLPPAPSSPPILRRTSLPSTPVSNHKVRLNVPEEVPETENEESQESRLPVPPAPTRTPSRNSVVSRMKPRTPGSKRNVLNPEFITSPPTIDETDPRGSRRTKQLLPLPRISPSTFTPHLPSTIESAENGGESDSSIEQFDSPSKSKSKIEPPEEVVEPNQHENLVLAATDVASNGAALAEVTKNAKQSPKDGFASKLPLVSLLGAKSEKARSPATPGHDEAASPEQRAPSTLEEFADSFLDYEGGMGDDGEEPSMTEATSKTGLGQKVHLRQEEEESTQNLVNEEADIRQAIPHENGTYPPTIESQFTQPKSDEATSQDVIDSLEVAPKSSAPMEPTPQLEQSQLETAPQPSSSQHEDHFSPSLELPPSISPVRPASEPLLPSQTQDGGRHLESAMNLLNKKSDEITRLEELLATTQTMMQTLQVENADLKAAAISWKDEKEVFTSTLETARKQQILAEKDVEFFREQYTRVSAFVSEVREENTSLQQRAEVAESQAKIGLEGIRTMFEGRVRELENEVGHHKRVAIFLIEQSERTGDEEIRRRAAEYPEMEKRHSRMEDMLSGATGMVHVFERQLGEKDRSVEALREEKNEIQKELDVLRVKVESMQVGGLQQLDMDGESARSPSVVMNPMDDKTYVYRCLWRKEGKAQCDAMFLTKEDLRRHLDLGGHL